MKFQFLGTAAAEGVPALLCTCEECRKSRLQGPRAFRTRSQALVDGRLLIDFPCDTLAHFFANNIDMSQITDCIITHSHSDHLYASDISMLTPGFANVDNYHIDFYGSDKVGKLVNERIGGNLKKIGRADFTEVKPFETFKVGSYTVTALPAVHDPNSGPLFYMISDGDKTLLYAHDTHYFSDEVWEYLAKTKPHFDLVSLDCTNACLPLTYIGHMGLAENVSVRERFLKEGYADESTRFFCNHFSHNGKRVNYDEFVVLAARENFEISYDGMLVEI